jgi:hypothetical protein
MMLRVPVSDTSFDLAEKVETTFLRKVAEITDQICHGMFIPGAAVRLKNRDGFSGPHNVIGFIRHAQFSLATHEVPLQI